MPARYDTALISKISKDPNTGFLHAKNVPIARVGVFPYRTVNDDVVMEAKLPTELLSDSTVESAKSKPITDDHPPQLVTADNSKELMKGFTAENAHVDGDMVKVDMTITDADLIKKIGDGKEELSIGFTTEVVPAQGEYQGVHYDSVQKNIQINHVAVVDKGRAGHSVRITGDSAEMVVVKEKGESMETTKVMLDGANVTVAVSDADQVAKSNTDLASLKKQLADAQAKVKDLQAQIEEAQGKADKADKLKKQADEAQAKADAADKQIEELQSKLKIYEGDGLDKMIEAKLALEKDAKPFLGDSYDFKGKTDKEIKIAVIKAIDDSFDAKDKSNDYINAFFDAVKVNKPVTIGANAKPKADAQDPAAEALAARYSLANKRGEN
ncbi:DUF2213 domain-containing protein [Lactobacillus delbrueckii subsp. lactis]|uniref:DUF2213 domain-containing protein n=1 Tax=Lactobacillus delbrueckii TaxID=1584 RepID=UPI001E4960CB|nr:DUF2213 domain-containing protein [Lactobacillus delbrueckii]MCD5528916.1 DUF2213 domain-containing protein [Lactobacillus delbrueckii subsp. lactis]MCS8607341.1 DUF2213 domain-containing protein [Lactobacillus delbrueckii subsp. lactis]